MPVPGVLTAAPAAGAAAIKVPAAGAVGPPVVVPPAVTPPVPATAIGAAPVEGREPLPWVTCSSRDGRVGNVRLIEGAAVDTGAAGAGGLLTGGKTGGSEVITTFVGTTVELDESLGAGVVVRLKLDALCEFVDGSAAGTTPVF